MNISAIRPTEVVRLTEKVALASLSVRHIAKLNVGQTLYDLACDLDVFLPSHKNEYITRRQR